MALLGRAGQDKGRPSPGGRHTHRLHDLPGNGERGGSRLGEVRRSPARLDAPRQGPPLHGEGAQPPHPSGASRESSPGTGLAGLFMACRGTSRQGTAGHGEGRASSGARRRTQTSVSSKTGELDPACLGLRRPGLGRSWLSKARGAPSNGGTVAYRLPGPRGPGARPGKEWQAKARQARTRQGTGPFGGRSCRHRLPHP